MHFSNEQGAWIASSVKLSWRRFASERRAAIHPQFPEVSTWFALATTKAMPMVRGLFPDGERETILRVLESSVVFLTCDNIADVLAGATWHSTAWDLADIYLGSIGAKRLGAGESCPVGLSEETTCYVSLAYFDETNPFSDFVVHEMAHVFHNWKRESVGLPHTRYREWLLQIDFTKRETFAYACEAYSRIQEQAGSGMERRRLLSEYASDWMPRAEGEAAA